MRNHNRSSALHLFAELAGILILALVFFELTEDMAFLPSIAVAIVIGLSAALLLRVLQYFRRS